MYCKNCGKPITSIAIECPYCHSKVVEDIANPNNDSNDLMYNNKSQYNTKSRANNSSLGNILATIAIIRGIILIVKAFCNEIDWAKNWGGMLPSERMEKARNWNYK